MQEKIVTMVKGLHGVSAGAKNHQLAEAYGALLFYYRHCARLLPWIEWFLDASEAHFCKTR